jgi:hypothetical protein
MSQEVNPYFVTSVGSATRMPDEYYEQSINLMKEKHEQRILNQGKAQSKDPTSWGKTRSKTIKVGENGVHGKHRVHHHHHKNYMHGL